MPSPRARGPPQSSMAVLTVDEFKSFCGISSSEFDPDFDIWEPVVEAELKEILNRDPDDLTDDKTIAAKPVFAEMILWRIAQAKPEKIQADPATSQSVGRLNITREPLDPIGYPRRIAARLGRFARPRRVRWQLKKYRT